MSRLWVLIVVERGDQVAAHPIEVLLSDDAAGLPALQVDEDVDQADIGRCGPAPIDLAILAAPLVFEEARFFQHLRDIDDLVLLAGPSVVRHDKEGGVLVGDFAQPSDHSVD